MMMPVRNAHRLCFHEETHSQPVRRRGDERRHHKRCPSRWPAWLWVSAVVVTVSAPSLFFGSKTALVQAHPVGPAEEEIVAVDDEPGDDGKKQDPGLDPEHQVQHLMALFLKNLSQFSYMEQLVHATHDKKITATQQNRGPPVMIGRRRNLFEHNVHRHFSVEYLEQLRAKTKRDTDHSGADDGNDDATITSIQEAIRAYVYQTPHDASIKANPQRIQHNAATANSLGLPPFPPSARKANAKLLRDMFYHSYNSYMNHAFPAAELLPLTCQPGTFDLVKLPALTLIDTLDTLLVLSDGLEFAKSVERLRQYHQAHQKQDGTGGIFAVNQNVSVFETTIRVLGGLLSGHQLAVAYLKTSEAAASGGEASSVHLPPVFLKDVFVGRAGDVYLQTPDAVHRILEQHDERQSRLATEDQFPDACSLGAVHQVGTELDDSHDWKQHCGAEVLGLEDCAATKSKKQTFINATNARLKQQEQRRLQVQEPQWEYDGFLLELAVDIGGRLMPAFETRTGIPYGTVNLLSGVPSGETTVASLAGGGTLSLEFELLSRLTGNLRYGLAAKLAIRALWMRRSPLHLVGKHIEIQRGIWTESLSGIGSNSDSFLEYLLKHYLLFPDDEDFWVMLQSAYKGIFEDARLGEWYADVDMKNGKQSWPKGIIKRVFESLMAFYPGMQSLMGELLPASRSLNSFFMVREFLGFLPERFSYSNWKVDGGISSGAAKYLLRPELLESCYFMHRATKRENEGSKSSSSGWQWAADFALHHLEQLTRAKCGYASVRGLNPATGNLQNYRNPENVKLSNEMPSFFLSETIKYLYLTFDDENIIHKDQDHDWIFTTEAHPIHFVPKFERTRDSEENNNEGSPNLKATKEHLRKKLKELKSQNWHGGYRASKKSETDGIVSARHLSEELWSDSTQPRKFRTSMKEVVDEIMDEHSEASSGHPLMSFFGAGASLLDPMHPENKELRYGEENNVAHMSWSSVGLGNGYGMRKACPNLFAPELSWVHALSGGAMDYTDIYVSAFSETDDDYPSSDSGSLLVTSAEALSVHGSGVFLGNMDQVVNTSEQCDISHPAPDTNPKPKDSAAQSSDQPSDSKSSGVKEGSQSFVQQVELAGVGSFEINAFPDGNGFFMRHLGTGESIMATFIIEAKDMGESVGDVTLMVYASMPRPKPPLVEPADTEGDDGEIADDGEEAHFEEEKLSEPHQSPWKLVGPKLASFFKKKPASDDANLVVEMGEPHRTVVVADLNSNAFQCEVTIIRRHLSSQKEVMVDGSETTLVDETLGDVVLATYPCAPALFGPTYMSRLLETDGVFIEYTILPPTEEDEFGCGMDADIPTVTPTSEAAPEHADAENASAESEPPERIEESCENNTIQMVQRGHCSFYTKAINQRNNANAHGVIVVNTEDDELFIMSHGEEEVGTSEDVLPVTVLVTGLDGEHMLELIEAESLRAVDERGVEAYLVAQIAVLKQEHVMDFEGGFKTVGDDSQWPIVRGTEEALQIFAEGGWGIHAMRKDGGSIRHVTGSNDLQLFLLRHSN